MTTARVAAKSDTEVMNLLTPTKDMDCLLLAFFLQVKAWHELLMHLGVLEKTKE